VNFPALSSSIWLPVTISSAPPAAPPTLTHSGGVDRQGNNSREMMQGSAYISAAVAASAYSSAASSSNSLTLHLPIESGLLHSFTAKVQEYFESMAPLGSSYYMLDERRRQGSDVHLSSSGGAADRSMAAAHPRQHEGRRTITTAPKLACVWTDSTLSLFHM
jgi:hypothetical protein